MIGERSSDGILASLDQAVAEMPPEELPSLIGGLESVKARAWARLTLPSHDRPQQPHMSEQGKLLTAEEAAEIARMPVKWLYRKTKGLRFRRSLSRKVIRFEEKALRNWLAGRQ